MCVYDSQRIMHVTRGNMMPMQPIRVAYPHAYVYPMHPTHVRLHSSYPAASQELEQEISSIQRDDEPVERSWDEMMGGHVELQCECLHHVAFQYISIVSSWGSLQSHLFTAEHAPGCLC